LSTSAGQAFSAVRARLEAEDSGISFPLRWQGENGELLPNPPAPFAFVSFNNDGSGGRPTAFGGGLGRNLYRNRARVEVYVFVPNNDTLLAALDHAETVAVRFRSFRSGGINCFSADVIPLGLDSSLSIPGVSTGVVGDYQVIAVEVELHFDQIG
jgi:hypothetical protein